MQKNKTKENIISLVLVQFFSLGLPLLAIPYLAKVLGAENLGEIVFAMAIAQIFLILSDYGFNLSAAKDIAIHRNNINKIYEIWSAVTLIKIFFSSICFLILLLSSLIFDRISGNLWLYILAFTWVLGGVIYPQWLFQGLEQLKYVSFVQVISRIVLFALLLFFVDTKENIYWAVFLQSAGGLLAGAIVFPKVIRIFSKVHKRLPSRTEVIKQLKDGWVIFLPHAFGSLYLSCNTFLLGIMLSPSLVANYYVAEKIVRASINLCIPITNAIFPKQVRDYKESKNSALRLSMKLLYILTGIFLIGSIFLFFFANYFIEIIFGTEFSKAETLLKIFSILPPLVMMTIILANLVMIPAGLERIFSKIIIFSSILNIFIFFIFVYFFSVIGAVLSNIIVEFVVFLLICFSLIKTQNNPFLFFKSTFWDMYYLFVGFVFSKRK